MAELKETTKDKEAIKKVDVKLGTNDKSKVGLNFDAKKVGDNRESKKEVKKDKKEEKVEKEVAVANGISLVVSPKYSFAICKMIKGKTPERAIEMLDNVVLGRQPVKMSGREVAHQKGRGVAGAKFPKNAAKAICEVVKQVNANAMSLGVENPVITIAMANKASTPMRRGGRQGKRTHIHIEVKSKTKLVKMGKK